MGNEEGKKTEEQARNTDSIFEGNNTSDGLPLKTLRTDNILSY